MKSHTRITYAPAEDDDKRKEAGGKELRSIQMLAMWHNVLLFYQDDLKPRLKTIPNGWRQYRLIFTCVEKLLHQVYDSLPNSTMARIIQTSKALEMRLLPKSASQKEYFVIPFNDFMELLQYIDDGACRMCLGDKETARKCPIRRILRDQVPPVEGTSNKYSDCPYSDGILTIAAKKAM